MVDEGCQTALWPQLNHRFASMSRFISLGMWHTGTSAGAISASYLSQGSKYTGILTEPAVVQGAIEVAALKTQVYKSQTPFPPVVRPGLPNTCCRVSAFHVTMLGMQCSEGAPLQEEGSVVLQAGESLDLRLSGPKRPEHCR